MAQLWGGRFTKETDRLVYSFNASISFDKRFYAQDIKGSIAHVMMLARQGILTDYEKDQIVQGLEGILDDVESGRLEISDKYEDIHSFVEATLIERIGEPGKKLHTGRSRNDQVALDMKLTRETRYICWIIRLRDCSTPYWPLWKTTLIHTCPGLRIFRRHSRSRWPIIWAPILKCSEETMKGCRIFTGG